MWPTAKISWTIRTWTNLPIAELIISWDCCPCFITRLIFPCKDKYLRITHRGQPRGYKSLDFSVWNRYRLVLNFGITLFDSALRYWCRVVGAPLLPMGFFSRRRDWNSQMGRTWSSGRLSEPPIHPIHKRRWGSLAYRLIWLHERGCWAVALAWFFIFQALWGQK